MEEELGEGKRGFAAHFFWDRTIRKR